MTETAQPDRAMDLGARRWMIKTIRQNFWRVAHWYEFDDLVQDGYLHYQRILVKYPNAVDRPHLMRLFERTFTRHLHTLANRRSREHAVLTTTPPHWQSPITPDPSRVLTLIAHAPPSLRTLLTALQTDPMVGQRLRAPYRRGRTHRETCNERLCRIAGIIPDPATDLPQLLKWLNQNV